MYNTIFFLFFLNFTPSTISQTLDCGCCETDNGHRYPYKLRKDKCEGFYTRLKGLESSVSLISFTKGEFRFNKNANGNDVEMYLSVPSAEKDLVRVVAQNITQKSPYYRMETLIKANEVKNWNMTNILLKEVRISDYKNISILGYTGSGANKIFHPIKAIQTNKALSSKNTSNELKITIIAKNSLDFISYKIDDEAPKELTINHEEEEKININLGTKLGKGIHKLTVMSREYGAPKDSPAVVFLLKI